MTFKRVLIANRGEIALRVVRACRDAGLASIAVYAEPDAGAPYTRLADEAVALGGSTAGDSYLDVERLLAAARSAGADAVHPGYGFLSENADFAQAVVDAGLTWIGPPPGVIRALGDKVQARAIAARAGAPLVPGTTAPVAGPAEAVRFADARGLPIAIKAAHGGGGRGLRIARDRDEVAPLFEAAVREATAAFGRGECFVEAYVERGRHVEAQVLADAHGTVAVVGTRDCSLQRRYQKLVEEAPAPFLTGAQRDQLEQSAAAICAAAGYVNAGTVEFLLSPRGELSFLEVNTRLQVEHSATEESTDTDLVRAQLLIAAGQPVSAALGTEPSGGPATPARRHAIEFRINAEDPAAGFIPSTGTITGLRVPSGPGIRLDSGVDAGTRVGGQFDSLLAKLIVTGRDRRQALERARRALAEFEIDGVQTTLPFFRAILAEPAFTAEGPDGFAVHTRWIEQDYQPGPAEDPGGPAAESAETGVPVRIGRRWLIADVPGLAQAREGPLARAREQARERRERAEQAAGDVIGAPMQGTVLRVAVADGDEVTAGQELIVVEAMKMENPLRAPHPGRVTDLHAAAGDTVAQGTVLCRVIPTGGEK
ncbi:MAG TPA: biotin carboxylase N-terminal domain-containing protein [Streptosporangiaceae bacterium]|nr:biotin carboxylase N-terminal domain-containing protein [Streptosporangiaceae bacterium]